MTFRQTFVNRDVLEILESYRKNSTKFFGMEILWCEMRSKLAAKIPLYVSKSFNLSFNLYKY